MTTHDSWVGIVDIADSIGATRQDLEALRRLTSPDLPTRNDPNRGRRILYRTREVIEWLERVMNINNAQRSEIIERSRILLPHIREMK